MAVAKWREDSAEKRRESLGAGQSFLDPAPPELKAAVVDILFYLELWPEISSHLTKLENPFDVCITCCKGHQSDVSA